MLGDVSLNRIVSAFERFWQISPFSVAIVAFVLGVIPFLVAVQFTAIGDVAYLMPTDAHTICTTATASNPKCLEKQVGYVHALNWSLVLLVLIPFAMFFAFASVQSTKEALEQMAASRMLVTKDWSQQVTDVKPIMDRLWRRFLLFGTGMFLIIVVLLARDWWCVVHLPLSFDVALGNVFGSAVREALVPEAVIKALRTTGCAASGHENDWSVAATFGSVPGLGDLAPGNMKPSLAVNYVFSAFAYATMALWSGLLFAYFGFVLALTVTIYELNAGRFGCQLVLDLNSSDKRKRFGFEYLEPVFGPCAYVATITFIMAFLMRIQNIYLRDREFSSIYSFMFEDIASALGGLTDIDLTSLLGKLGDFLTMMKKIFAFNQFADPQSLLGAPAVLIILGVMAAALGFILRRAANDAQRRVLSALDQPGGKAEAAAQYFGLSVSEARARADSVETWPLSWPELRYAMRMFLMGIICYVFYRVAFIWIGVVAARVVYGGLGSKK